MTTMRACLQSLPAPRRVAALLAAAAILPGSSAMAITVLFHGGDPGPTSGADGAVMTHLESRYGVGNVTYMQGSAAAADGSSADGFDLVIISSTLDSGTVRNKYEDTPAGLINWEQALMRAQAGEFNMSNGGGTTGSQTQITILDPSSPLAAGLSGTVTVFSSPSTTSYGTGALGAGVNRVAATADGSNHAITSADVGDALLGDGSPGNPAVAAGRRVMFFMENASFNNLTPEGLSLFDAATDWAANAPPDTLPKISAAEFTAREEVTITLEDFDDGVTQSDIDPATIQLFRDDFLVDPGSYTVTKTGSTTTIVDTFTPDTYTLYTYRVDGRTTAATGDEAFSRLASARSFLFPELSTIPAGSFPAGEWELMCWLGQGVTGAGDSYSFVVDTIQSAPVTETANVPVLNFADPENPGGAGVFHPNDPFPSDTGVNDDDFIYLARTTLSVSAAGDHTISVQADDGAVLHLGGGAVFTAVSGAAGAVLGPHDPSTAGFPADTANTDMRLTANFPAAGDYELTMIWWERGGGAHLEAAWAPGDHSSIGDTADWELIGGDFGRPFVSQWPEIPESVLPAIPPSEAVGAVFYYGAMRPGGNVRNVGQLFEFMNGLAQDPPASTFTDCVPAELAGAFNYSDNGGGGGGRFGSGAEYPGSTPGTGNDDNIVGIFHGKFVVEVEGDYTIEWRSDDGFIFRFCDPSVQFFAGNGNANLSPSALNEFYFPGGTGDTQSRAAVHLAPGEYEFKAAWWEGTGGSHFELNSTPEVALDGASSSWTNMGADLIPPTVAIGVAGPGFSVVHAGPGVTPAFAAGDFASGGFDTKLDAVAGNPANQATLPRIHVFDPESAGGNPTPGVARDPWPADTPSNDDQWGMRGDATLAITEEDDYYIGYQGDDGTYIDIVGQTWDSIAESEVASVIVESDPIGNPGVFDRLMFDGGTGNSRTVGCIHLAPGNYTMRFGFYEMGGGSYLTIFGAKGDSYVIGTVLPPIAVGVGGSIFTSPQPLQFVGDTPPPFLITDFQIDSPKPGDITFTFTSVPGASYAVDATNFEFDPPWAEVDDGLVATGETLTTTVDDAILDILFGDDRNLVFVRARRLP